MTDCWHIWIDTGGTFTDCIAISPGGDTLVLKVLSNSRLRSRIISQDGRKLFLENTWPISTDILKGYSVRKPGSTSYRQIESYDPESKCLIVNEQDWFEDDLEVVSDEEVPVFASRLITGTAKDDPLPLIKLRLGTTRGTNALLEKKGAKVTFITTKGHGDVIGIGTQQRPDLFSLTVDKPKPLYQNVIEVSERTWADGTIEQELTPTEIKRVCTVLKQQAPSSIAVAFLNAYKNSQSEILLKEALEKDGHAFISTSHGVSPTIKLLPRAETTVVNAYLAPIIQSYVQRIKQTLRQDLHVLTSAGGLVNADLFQPKDSLLSGPAGGLVGVRAVAQALGREKVISFDMGGTSTDVSRYEKGFDYKFETKVGDHTIAAPALYIETIAAGGGSVCTFDGEKLNVEDASAGAHPGPACYGAGGPLTVTDINVLLGRINPDFFGIPIDPNASEKVLAEMIGPKLSKEQALIGFEQIANEKMAEAIKHISTQKGFDPSEYSLMSFGGAGGLHACKIAELLRIREVIVPANAGLLSAFGIGQAFIEEVAERQVLEVLSKVDVQEELGELREKAASILHQQGFEKTEVAHQFLLLRLVGQEHALEVDYCVGLNIASTFKGDYEDLYGHWIPDAEIELESIRVIVRSGATRFQSQTNQKTFKSTPTGKVRCLTGGRWQMIHSFDFNALQSNKVITGPAVIGSLTNTVFVAPDWTMTIDAKRNAILQHVKVTEQSVSLSAEAEVTLFSNRLTAIAEEMGAMLQRAAFSINIRERLDFSCAILDAEGYLIVNAPHIPVHLGSLGICVRSLMETIPMEEGDVIITNHPGFGGSHLPDVTLVAPVFLESRLICFVANRAHHAEIGGKRPGSMPPDAQNLEEEGVVIEPTYLVRKGKVALKAIEAIFTEAKYPTRALKENMADLRGSLASIRLGITEVTALRYGYEDIASFMRLIRERARIAIHPILCKDHSSEVFEELDLGEKIRLSLRIADGRACFDFQGSSDHSESNFHATRAIVYSAILYVLRLFCPKGTPLNEGLLEDVEIKLPTCFLNPDFSGLADACPPVVAGNTETSQRLVDTILKAFGVVACSQGTMNNVLFGDETFGYYETICGGVGATEGHEGASAVHQHMTNTRITDAEVLEWKYPVRIERFEIRKNSGGRGKWSGGNGVRREIRFLKDLSGTIVSQHRKNAPYGIDGGDDGETGRQWIRRGEEVFPLEGVEGFDAKEGDVLVIETPGGGGFGGI